MADVERTLYGHKREKNGGGLYGRVHQLELAFDKQSHGWLTLIIVGGVLSVAFDVAILVVLINLLRTLL